MNIDDISVLYSVDADQIEVGDQIIIEDDLIEVYAVLDTDDIDEVLVKGFNLSTGHVEEWPLLATDSVEVWAV